MVRSGICWHWLVVVTSYKGKDLETLSTLRRYRGWIMTHFQPYIRGNVVEVGAGIGNISDLLHPFAETLDLVEPSENLIKPLEKKFEHYKRVTVIKNSFENFVSSKSEKTYDCIVFVNVLEHIEEDKAALKECYRILRPGGHLLIMVPSLMFLYSKLDKLVGHYRRYERSELREKILEAAFQLIDLRFFDSIGIIPWWILNTIVGATEFNPFLMGLYDRFFVPITRVIETFYAPPIGKNLIAISRRSK